ncbi:V-type proton ATPase subunit H isoform X2 [Nematostella vectensis]|uniref:V-type proton ATPase subunit H isoform X2 n=1 Tax=Nematostella vectensis TaxID=45351 RepID=UPI00138FF4A8|nr:V-type proton ATPase subunit H isoform X2 [Nematostella vectensis]
MANSDNFCKTLVQPRVRRANLFAGVSREMLCSRIFWGESSWLLTKRVKTAFARLCHRLRILGKMSTYQRLDVLIAKQDTEMGETSATTGFVIAGSRLVADAVEVRKQTVNWQSYVHGKMISQEDYSMIADYDCMDPVERAKIISDRGDQLAKTCLSLLVKLTRDHTIRYILVLIDDMLNEERSRVAVFHDFGKKNNVNLWGSFLNLINRQDQFIVHQAGVIVAKLACWGNVRLPESDLNFFLSWLKNQLTSPTCEYLHSIALSLQLMLRVESYKEAFFKLEGINSIVATLLRNKIGFQLQYQLIFTLWLLSFDPRIAERMVGNNAVIPVLADILRDSDKEKVTRIITATLRNLLDKPEEKKRESAVSMIQSKLLPVLSILNGKTWADEDIKADIEYVYEKLNEVVQDLSNFDEYAAEVRSGRLEWSPVHKSEKFWRENAHRLNENKYELLKVLNKLLESSEDPLILAVAAHDTGEYVRHYPRGKTVLESLGCKGKVMQMMTHNDPSVRKEALLAVQKLMVHNWEYLGKALKAS